MTDVINTPEHPRADLACGEEAVTFQTISDVHKRHPKLSKRLPLIVVEPSDGEVESGELCWPPDDLRITDAVSCLRDNTKYKPDAQSQITHACDNTDKLKKEDNCSNMDTSVAVDDK